MRAAAARERRGRAARGPRRAHRRGLCAARIGGGRVGRPSGGRTNLSDGRRRRVRAGGVVALYAGVIQWQAICSLSSDCCIELGELGDQVARRPSSRQRHVFAGLCVFFASARVARFLQTWSLPAFLCVAFGYCATTIAPPSAGTRTASNSPASQRRTDKRGGQRARAALQQISRARRISRRRH